MTIGNMPPRGDALKEGKTYWRLAIGQNAVSHRFFDGGWRAFEFLVLHPFHDPYEDYARGAALPVRFRIAFAYWLPFMSL